MQYCYIIQKYWMHSKICMLIIEAIREFPLPFSGKRKATNIKKVEVNWANSSINKRIH